MRVLHAALLILFVCVQALPAADLAQVQETADAVAIQAEDPELEAQVRQLAAKLRCPTCRALSVAGRGDGILRRALR
jgi:cytochrome c-type biogenesis protein CcmH/NrfF